MDPRYARRAVTRIEIGGATARRSDRRSSPPTGNPTNAWHSPHESTGILGRFARPLTLRRGCSRGSLTTTQRITQAEKKHLPAGGANRTVRSFTGYSGRTYGDIASPVRPEILRSSGDGPSPCLAGLFQQGVGPKTPSHLPASRCWFRGRWLLRPRSAACRARPFIIPQANGRVLKADSSPN